MKYFITGTRRGLGKYLYDKYDTVDNLEDCDIFINNKHDGFTQVSLLKQALKLGKRVINIGSIASDSRAGRKHHIDYAVEKAALERANEYAFYQGYPTTIIKYGYLDTERVAHIEADKMSVEYAASIIDWVLKQPHRIKEIVIDV